jgi:hypothetical protein
MRKRKGWDRSLTTSSLEISGYYLPILRVRIIRSHGFMLTELKVTRRKLSGNGKQD